MKSPLNFYVEKDDGAYDMYTEGLWVNSFTISPPENETKLVTNPIVDGSRFASSRIKSRPITIGFDIEASSLLTFDELKHKIYSIFISEKPYKIVRDLRPDLEIYAVQDGSYDINNITESDGEFTIKLIMPKPDIEGLEKIKTKLNPININGTRKTSPTIQVDFTVAATFFKVTNQDGKYVNVIYNFADGDQLILDFNKRKIIINGLVHMTALDWANSEWFKLVPGDNKLTVDPVGVANVQVTYTERWL